MWLERSKLLFGEERLARLQKANVLVVGLGGVGAYVAEMLVRSGVGKMTIADSDCVGESNINRQLIALHSTIGRPKKTNKKSKKKDFPYKRSLFYFTLFSQEHLSPREALRKEHRYLLSCCILTGSHGSSNPHPSH